MLVISQGINYTETLMCNISIIRNLCCYRNCDNAIIIVLLEIALTSLLQTCLERKVHLRAFHSYHNCNKSNNCDRHYTTLVDRMLIVKRNVIMYCFSQYIIGG